MSSTNPNAQQITNNYNYNNQCVVSTGGTITSQSMEFTTNPQTERINPESKAKSLPEYNILMLGETGSGKSTSINALVNYIKFSTYQEAAEGKIKLLIESKFEMTHPDTREQILIETGTDTNERNELGKSCTKSPTSYVLRFGGGIIRIIDTPGIGDTSGIQSDKENFDQILQCLQLYSTLNAICIFVNSTETRESAKFCYCVSELLTHLHKSASENIFFCFTFSRSTDFLPGQGFYLVKNFLAKAYENLKLELIDGGNCFFLENDSFRYLLASHKGHKFKRPPTHLWDQSADQCELMLKRILKLKPHKLTETVSLNNARKIILKLGKPIIELQVNHKNNLAKLELSRENLKKASDDLTNLARDYLFIELDDLVVVPLSYPRIVCSNHSCTKVSDILFEGKEVKIHQSCHEECREVLGISHAPAGALKNLRNCEMLKDGNCRKCSCSWSKHLLRMYEFKTVKKLAFDSVKELDSIKHIQTAAQEHERLIKLHEDERVEYEYEIKVMEQICAKFTYILNLNSNMTYNKYIESYIEQLMEFEEAQINNTAHHPKDKFNSLKQMKDAHVEEVKTLEKLIAQGKRTNLTIDDVSKYQKKLFELKKSGTTLKGILAAIEHTDEGIKKRMDKEEVDFVNNNVSDKKSSILQMLEEWKEWDN